MKNFESKLIARIFGIQEPIDEHAYAILGRAAIHAVLGILTFELTINVTSSFPSPFFLMARVVVAIKIKKIPVSCMLDII